MSVAAVQQHVEAPPANLVEKLAAVMAQVERVPKNGHNQFHNYDYATEADITDAVRAAMARYGVMLVPSVEHVEWKEMQTKSGQVERLATLTVKFTVTDGKDRIEFNVLGEGQDRGDKATYKAMTGATKYALLKLFLIPTGDDPETEEEERPHNGVRGRPQAPTVAPQQQRPAATMPPPHVAALWTKARAKYGEAATDEFAGAALKALGENHPKSSQWTVEQAKAVEAVLFDDIRF